MKRRRSHGEAFEAENTHSLANALKMCVLEPSESYVYEHALESDVTLAVVEISFAVS